MTDPASAPREGNRPKIGPIAPLSAKTMQNATGARRLMMALPAMASAPKGEITAVRNP